MWRGEVLSVLFLLQLNSLSGTRNGLSLYAEIQLLEYKNGGLTIEYVSKITYMQAAETWCRAGGMSSTKTM